MGDWASMTGMPFLMPLSSNLLSGSEPRMLEVHFDNMVKAFLDGYHGSGGSRRLDFDLISTCMKLGMCDAASGMMGFTRIIQNNLKPSDPKWKQFKDRWDPEINDNYVQRATVAQCNHVLDSWSSKKLNLYGSFKQWLKDNARLLLKKDIPKPVMPKPPPDLKAKAKAKT